jgi:hypothetical protein
MEIYQTVKNDDGTVSIFYKRTVKDINGADVEIPAETHRRTREDVKEEYDHNEQMIASYTNRRSELQTELDEIDELG